MPKKTDNRPHWAVEATKVLLDRKMYKKDLAEKLGICYGHLINVMSGWSGESDKYEVRNAVCGYLGIPTDNR